MRKVESILSIIEYEEAIKYPRADDVPGYINRRRPTRQVKNKRQIDTPKDLGNLDLMRVKFEQIRKIE